MQNYSSLIKNNFKIIASLLQKYYFCVYEQFYETGKPGFNGDGNICSLCHSLCDIAFGYYFTASFRYKYYK